MSILEKLNNTWKDVNHPFLIYKDKQLNFTDILDNLTNLSSIQAGDVVALIGDFDPASISAFLKLIDIGAIIVPLTKETAHDHEYFFEAAHVNVIIKDNQITKRVIDKQHALLQQLQNANHSGLILFSTGTTGRPKAILHDLTLFLKRFETPRPTLKTFNFLLFDHIGGINTLLHTLFNKGIIIAPEARSVDSVLEACAKYEVEVLPTTPTFLRMMLISGLIPEKIPASLKIITYGTERMDQPTLDELCRLLPQVDFRQTFGMSELGILRIKSAARDSLFMKIGGEGIETRVVDNVLQIRSKFGMVGYLNAESPFDDNGWYNTKDIVEVNNGFYKVVGRVSDVINVGGLKFMASEVERVALEYPGIALVKAFPRENPITGQHVEMTIQPNPGVEISKEALSLHFKSKLQPHMIPKRLKIEKVSVGHRFKKV